MDADRQRQEIHGQIKDGGVQRTDKEKVKSSTEGTTKNKNKKKTCVKVADTAVAGRLACNGGSAVSLEEVTPNM